jgi:hypothetical protein
VDTTFPFSSNVSQAKVGGDYIIVGTGTSPYYTYVVKRTQEAWQQCKLDSVLTASGDTVGDGGIDIAGVGPNYFVVKYNAIQLTNISQQYTNWEIAIVNFSPTGLVVDNSLRGQRFYDGWAYDSEFGYDFCGGYFSHVNVNRPTYMRAFCGDNYMVLASGDENSYGTYISHFRYSTSLGHWQSLSGGGYYTYDTPRFDLVGFAPHRVYIGKNFIVVALNYAGGGSVANHTELKVYRRDGPGTNTSDLCLVDDVTIENTTNHLGGIGGLALGDDYYAYTYSTTDFGGNDMIAVKTWNGSSFVYDPSASSLFPQPTVGSLHVGLTAMVRWIYNVFTYNATMVVPRAYFSSTKLSHWVQLDVDGFLL